MRLLPLLRSPLTLPVAFAVSMAAWLGSAVSHRVPHNQDRGMVWVYVSAVCAAPGNPSDCRRTGQNFIRVFDTREDCAAHLNADLSTAGNPRLMGSCLRQQEA